MLNLLSNFCINNVNFRVLNFQFENRARSFNFVNCLLFRISSNFLFTKTFCNFHRIHKANYIRTHLTNTTGRKSVDKKSSKMSFPTSTDSRSNAGEIGKVTAGTSVCYQFWITNSILRLKAVCPKPSSDPFWKRFTYETLRKFEFFDDYTAGKNGQRMKLKVMNYNILSQALLEQHHYLYAKQKRFLLQWDFRKDLILQEILTVNPDILCLQEVEGAQVPYFFKKLENYGYRSVIKMKTRQKGDGLSVYYRSSNIKLIEDDSVEFRQPGIIELENRDNVGLFVRLEKGGKEFIVANTHLLYNPKRTEVRLAQVQMLMAELHRMARKDEDDIARILLMGDFNSVPDSPVIKFIVDGKLLSQYRPLPLCLGISPQSTHMQQESKLFHSEKQNLFAAECRGESIASAASSSVLEKSFLVSHTFNFSSVHNLDKSNRSATTFQDDWVMVDYIFYTNGFEMLSRLSLPTPSDCDQYIHYLPNRFNPSDHLPLVAEFEIL